MPMGMRFRIKNVRSNASYHFLFLMKKIFLFFSLKFNMFLS